MDKKKLWIIPRSLIFITRQNEILMIKGAPNKKLWANLYNGIGGHIEWGENVYQSARRELAEESGLHNIDLHLCGILLINGQVPGTEEENRGIGIYVFRGEYSDGPIIASTEGALEWINEKDLTKIPLVEDLPVLLPKVLAWRIGQPPFSGLYEYVDHHLKISFD